MIGFKLILMVWLLGWDEMPFRTLLSPLPSQSIIGIKKDKGVGSESTKIAPCLFCLKFILLERTYLIGREEHFIDDVNDSVVRLNVGFYNASLIDFYRLT